MNYEKYNEKTREKLIKLYNNVMPKYSLENKKLKDELIDSKATLDINFNLLYNIKMSSENEQRQIKDLINKCKTALEKTESLMLNEKKIKIKLFRLKEYIENMPVQINEEINDLQNKNNITRNEVNKKENIIKKLKQDLERTRNNCLFKEARTEVYVIEPTKKTIDKNAELIDAKIILEKVNKRHKETKKSSKALKKELNKLRKELKELKKKIPKEKNNEQFFEELNYNAIVEEEEKEFEEEEEKEDSEQEGDEDNDGKSTKKKEKEYAKLKEKYNSLKKIFAEGQKKINEYKKIYKNIKKNIDKIGESINKK